MNNTNIVWAHSYISVNNKSRVPYPSLLIMQCLSISKIMHLLAIDSENDIWKENSFDHRNGNQLYSCLMQFIR